MTQASNQFEQALAVATVSELRSYLRGQLDRFEFIADIVQRHMDHAVEMGDYLETAIPQTEFRRLCEQTLMQTVEINRLR